MSLFQKTLQIVALAIVASGALQAEAKKSARQACVDKAADKRNQCEDSAWIGFNRDFKKVEKCQRDYQAARKNCPR